MPRRYLYRTAPRRAPPPPDPYKADPIPTLSPPAQAGFESFSLVPQLLRAVAAAGYTEPRPIQRATLPAVLEGRDVLGLAQTGTGKTAAFALPILQRLSTSKRRGNGPRALVVAPTRELASQISAEFERLGRYTQARVATIFGGVGAAPQVRALRAGPEVVVACPGRLLDLVAQRALTLGDVEMLVLDEADHMFDMGFLPDLRRILALLPERRQNLLFSATMPPEVRKLADRTLRNPKVVELAHERPPETIEHRLLLLAEGEKESQLERLLRGPDFRSAIVFLRTKRRAKKLAERLGKRGFRAVALQGNLSQSRREEAMEGFRKGRYDVLVATDIAARGIDVAKVSHVVNFDLPTTPEHYTHRIGRTGRSEETGRAITFATRDDAAGLRAIERHLGARIPLAEGSAAAAPESARADEARPRRSQRPTRTAPTSATSPVARRRAEGGGQRAPQTPTRRAAPATAKPAEPAQPFGSGLDAGAPRTGTRAEAQAQRRAREAAQRRADAAARRAQTAPGAPNAPRRRRRRSA